jgi:anti-sigma factor RsiW
VARPPAPRWAWGGLGLLAGSLATAALMMSVVLPLQRESALAGELVGSHVRALMPGHLADVASSDRHTVKPWFQGKLDYAPPVEDPSPDTPLVGGRLDVVDGRPVAVLVYRQRAHFIDAFVWPSSKPSALRTQQLRGFSVVSWSDGAMQHWLVSDLNGPALVAFAEQLRNVPR